MQVLRRTRFDLLSNGKKIIETWIQRHPCIPIWKIKTIGTPFLSQINEHKTVWTLTVKQNIVFYLFSKPQIFTLLPSLVKRTALIFLAKLNVVIYEPNKNYLIFNIWGLKQLSHRDHFYLSMNIYNIIFGLRRLKCIKNRWAGIKLHKVTEVLREPSQLIWASGNAFWIIPCAEYPHTQVKPYCR